MKDIFKPEGFVTQAGVLAVLGLVRCEDGYRRPLYQSILLINSRRRIFFLKATPVPFFGRRDVTRRHSLFPQQREKDGAHTRTEMLSTGFSMDTCDFHRPGRLLVLLRLCGGALYM